MQSIDFIEAHLRESIGVTEVAERSGLSSWHFQRIFKDHLGMTIGSYLRKRRLSRALDELIHPNRKIIDIALDYEFGSPEAFSRAFKAEFSMSPLEFRRKAPKIVPFKKPKLEKRHIEYLMQEMKIEPEIRNIPSQIFMGLPVSFIGPVLDFWVSTKTGEGQTVLIPMGTVTRFT